MTGVQTCALPICGNVAGSTTATLTLSSVQESDAATYTCTITNDVGSVTTAPRTLQLDVPTIVTPPSDILLAPAGSSNVFTVVATGLSALSYQWRTNGVDVPNGGHFSGATTASLTVNPSAGYDALTYSVEVTAAACPSKKTNSAVLTILCPTITVGPITLYAGVTTVPYSNMVSASGGSAPYTFAVTSGILPPALVLASGGGISGTPTAVGVSNITITATDVNGCSGSSNYSVVIVIAESDAPTVKFDTTPANKATVLSVPTVLTGTAKDM